MAPPPFKRMGIIPAMAERGGVLARGDSPNFLMLADQGGKVSIGRRIGMLAAVLRRGLNNENGFVSDRAADLVVFAKTGLDRFVMIQRAPVAFAGLAQVGSGIFQQGDQARFIVDGLGQAKELGRQRARHGTDHRPEALAVALNAGGPEGDGFDFGIQADVESVGKNVSEVVVSLQDVKARAVEVGDDLILLVEDGRDDGAKLAQAGEEFLFEILRLGGEILDAGIDEVPLPELGRAPSSNNGRPLKNMNSDARSLQGLGTTEPGESGSDNRDRSKLFHKGNLGGDLK